VRGAAPPHSNNDRSLVFNAGMYRVLFAALAVALVLIAPATASGRIIEIGDVGVKPVPSCPTSPCEVISRTTAFQTRIGTTRDMFVVPADGRIVAWTITLGKPGKKQQKFFEENLGGPSQAGITILKQGDRRYGRVLAQGPLQPLTSFFGQTAQFPLTTTLPVTKGSVVALSVPTWAPALGLGLARDNVWRASRDVDACDDTQTQSAQIDLQDLTRYKCFYRTARLSYSATLITTPKPPKPPKTTKP
jgi:hypothetical protein